MVLLALASIAGVARARSDVPWDGGYLGVNLGYPSTSSCDSWALSGATIDSAVASAFNHQNCSAGALVGGVQFGENYQFKRLVLGVGADLDLWSAKNLNEFLTYTGAVPPAGTYAFSSRQNPSAIAVIGPRVGYAGDLWMPYLRAGAVISAGSHNSTLVYTPTAAPSRTASFSGGRAFSTAGWAAGGGFELGLNGAWSITAEYLHVSLGKGSDSATACSGTTSACAAFSGVSFDNIHEGFSANLLRIGVTYWFRYW